MQGSLVAKYHGPSIAAVSLYPKLVLVSHIVARGDLEKDRAGLERVEMCVGTVHLHTIPGQGGLYSHRLCLRQKADNNLSKTWSMMICCGIYPTCLVNGRWPHNLRSNDQVCGRAPIDPLLPHIYIRQLRDGLLAVITDNSSLCTDTEEQGEEESDLLHGGRGGRKE